MKTFTGTRRLLRLAFRRDRISLPVTMLVAWGMVAGSAPALLASYPDYESQFSYIAASAPSVVGRMFQGTVQGVNLGSILMAETFIFTAVILAIMSIFIVTRHTRHNEETGAGELISSGIVGRSAPLTAAMIEAVLANAIVSVLIFASLAPIEELGRTGSAMMALSLGSIGIFFAGVAAITAQLSDYRRGANGMAIGALGAFFLIRAFGDALGDISADALSVTASWISWMSPLGWGTLVLPFAENRLLPLILIWVATLLTFAVSFYLLRKRDLGSSIFESRPGRDRAKPSLLSLSGLAIKLQKGAFWGWSVGFFVTGMLSGVVVNDFSETFTESEVFSDFIALDSGEDIITALFAAMLPIYSAMLSGILVSAVAKMQDEESSGRIEYLLSTAASRTKWMLSHISLTTIVLIANVLMMGVVTAVGFLLAADTTTLSFVDITMAALVSIPAMLVFLSVITFVFAAFGRFVKTFAWSYYAYIALIGSFASIFAWPRWVSYLSPFTHTPVYPSENPEIAPIFIMTAIAAALLFASTKLFSSRDISLK